MTEPTHQYFDQIDADLSDVLDALWALMNAGEWDAGRDALRLTLAGVWSDAQQVLVRRLMAGDKTLPANPFMPGPATPAPAGNESESDIPW